MAGNNDDTPLHRTFASLLWWCELIDDALWCSWDISLSTIVRRLLSNLWSAGTFRSRVKGLRKDGLLLGRGDGQLSPF